MRISFFLLFFGWSGNLLAQTPVPPVPDLLEVIIADGFLPDTTEFPGQYTFVSRVDIAKVVMRISDTEEYVLDFFSDRIWQVTDRDILSRIKPDKGYSIEVVDFSGRIVGIGLISLRDLDKNKDIRAVIPVYRKE